MSDDIPVTHNVFADRSVEESKAAHPSAQDHVSVLQPDTNNIDTSGELPVLQSDIDQNVEEAAKQLSAEDWANAAAAFSNMSKACLQGFLYIEKVCTDAGQLCLDMAEYLKDAATPTDEGTDTDG